MNQTTKRKAPSGKTGRHDIAEILLKVALKHQKSIYHWRYNTKKSINH
jgi:hypothetical protein